MTGAAVAAAAAAGGAAWAVRGRSSSFFGPSVWHGARDRRSIALTFDDGPSPATAEILDLLQEFAIRATFFQCGANVRRYPDIARHAVSLGHEVGNHSDTHPLFVLKSGGFIDGEFRRAQETLVSVTGVRPALLRAPFGVRWPGFRGMQQRLGLKGVMWSVIGLDWKLPGAQVAQRVTSRVSPGGIVCLHDGRGISASPDVRSTVEAVKIAVPQLMKAGYHFETVTELLCPTP